MMEYLIGGAIALILWVVCVLCIDLVKKLRKPVRKVPKYLVIPGNIRSKNDGDLHYITAHQLIQLYRVDPDECIVYSPQYPLRELELIPLTVRFDGEYEIPS